MRYEDVTTCNHMFKEKGHLESVCNQLQPFANHKKRSDPRHQVHVPKGGGKTRKRDLSCRAQVAWSMGWPCILQTKSHHEQASHKASAWLPDVPASHFGGRPGRGVPNSQPCNTKKVSNYPSSCLVEPLDRRHLWSTKEESGREWRAQSP